MLPPVFGLVKQLVWSKLLQKLSCNVPNDWDDHKERNNVNHVAWPLSF